MATNRKEIERMLHCNKAAGLSYEFQETAQNFTARFLAAYSSAESGYQLDKELVENRVKNLMLCAIEKNPALTAEEFASNIKLPEIFMDRAAVMYLTELAGEEGAGDYFYFAYHFFAAYVFSYIYRHPYYVKPLDRREVICVLYNQVYHALKSCAAKKVNFSFKILNLMFQAAVFELNGIERLPFTLHRRDAEQYFRFRAAVGNHNYSVKDTSVIADALSLSTAKIQSYWRLYLSENNGFLSASQIFCSENLEHIFGKTEEPGFTDVEISETRNRLFHSEEDRNIFDSLVSNGDGVFSRKEIEALNTTRYRINQVKQAIKQDRAEGVKSVPRFRAGGK